MKIILGFLASFALAQNYNQVTKLVLDLEKRYSFSWTTVLFKEGVEEMSRAFNIGKMLMMSTDVVSVKCITSYINDHEAEGINRGRSFYLILGDRVNLREELKQLSYSVNVEDTIWLVCLSEKMNLKEYFRDVNIVYNMDMLVMQPLPDGNGKITEVYKIDREQPLKIMNYGVWSFAKGLKSQVPAQFYLRRRNLEGINFKVAAKQKTKRKGKKGRHHFGILGTVWKDLQFKLNFTSTFTTVNNSELFLTGGIIGFMNQNKMDVGLTEVTMSRDSCSVFHCLRPVLMTKSRLYFKKTRLSIRWDSVLKPFHLETWITIFLWFVISSIGVDASFRMSRKYGLEREIISYNVFDSALTVFNAVCQKGSVIIPESLPCRVIFFVSYSVASILFTVYSASLASFVTVQEPYFPFENLKQLVQIGTYTLQPIRYSDLYMFYANAADAFDREVYTKLIARESSLPSSKREALDRVCHDEKMVYIGTEFQTKRTVMDINRKGRCEIISPAEPLNTVYITILLSKTSHFKELFNIQLGSLILTGLVNRHMKRAQKEIETSEENTFAGVGMTQVIQIYAILIFGIIASFVIFIMEKFAHKTLKCKTFGKNDLVKKFCRQTSFPSVFRNKKQGPVKKSLRNPAPDSVANSHPS